MEISIKSLYVFTKRKVPITHICHPVLSYKELHNIYIYIENYELVVSESIFHPPATVNDEIWVLFPTSFP